MHTTQLTILFRRIYIRQDNLFSKDYTKKKERKSYYCAGPENILKDLHTYALVYIITNFFFIMRHKRDKQFF